MSPYWKIAPTRPIKGFTVTYMPRTAELENELTAVLEAMRMERFSGIRWSVTKCER